MYEVFLSYRRADSLSESGRIHDYLTETFGRDRVFKDVYSIAPGEDFRRVIDRAVGECSVLLAIIGDEWLETAGAGGARRLDDPDDYVRLELEAALSRGIPVIPVLVGDGPMPRAEDLPAQIRELSYRNGIRVRPDPDFKGDMDRLTARIRSCLPASGRVWGMVRSRVNRRAALGAGLAALGTGAAYYFSRPPADLEIVEEGTGQLVIREFEVLYHPSDENEGLAAAKGFGGKCRVPDKFSRLENVRCRGYDFDHAEGHRLILRRDPDEFEKAIRPDQDTYDLPSPSDFELANSTRVNLAEFSLTAENTTSSFLDLVFLYHDPREGALVSDSWELVVPPIPPHSERRISDFHRFPGYFLIFASTHGTTAQHLVSANLYSGTSPTLKIFATADGLGGRLTW